MSGSRAQARECLRAHTHKPARARLCAFAIARHTQASGERASRAARVRWRGCAPARASPSHSPPPAPLASFACLCPLARLCAQATSAEGKVAFVTPPPGAKVGERISFPGFEGEAAAPSRVDKKKLFELVAPQLAVAEGGVAAWNGVPFMTSAGPCTVESIPAGSPIK